jgi:prolyl oligopeptidase
VWNEQLLVTLRSDWTIGDRDKKTWPRGALLATPLAAVLAGKRDFTMLFEPAPNKSLEGLAELKSSIVTNELVDIKNELFVWKLAKGKWSKKPFGKPTVGTTSLSPLEAASATDDYWLVPSSSLLITFGDPCRSGKARIRTARSRMCDRNPASYAPVLHRNLATRARAASRGTCTRAPA